MARSRLRIVSQLFFLVGLPVLVLTGLFGGGVYLGLEHRERVLVFERDVLRLDVTVPPASASPQPGAASKIVTAQRQPVGAEREDVTVPAQPSPQPPPQLVPPAKPDGAALPDVLVDPSGAVADPPPGATPPGVAPALPNSAPPATTPTEPSAVSAMPSAEGPSLGLPVRVSVKVLVDSELIEREADWIAYVQRLVSKASQIYATNFGVELALYGVSTWDVATRGMRAEALLDDLRTRPREGAHLLIGLTSRPYDADIAGQGDLPTAQSPINGAYAVVYATTHHGLPHLMTLLHEVGHIFGAVDIAENQSASAGQASWMNARLGADTRAPWIDPENRKRIITRKALPFAPPPRSDGR